MAVLNKEPATTTNEDSGTQLSRTISFPLLVFYGVGVTVGAGIFALVGEILSTAGNQAPLAFLLSGAIAALTGFSYTALVSEYPKAGGEAVYVRQGIGARAGKLAGLGVVVTGTISSAVVAHAFAGYATSVVAIPKTVAALGVVAVLVGVAWWGVRESVILAAVVTALEVGTLLVVTAFGAPDIGFETVTRSFDLFEDGAATAVLAGAGIAFFAFIGFEDIANMAEETIDPRTAAPRAIRWTLGITIVAYVALALVAAALPNRAEIVGSDAPMAVIFESVSGLNSAPIATIASFAMVNGILVQIVMASRVLYGMSSDNQLPALFGQVSRTRKTPTTATLLVGAAIALLVMFFPLVTLARATSVITLTVFTLVNIALVRIARRNENLRQFRWIANGIAGTVASAGLGIWQVAELL